MILLSIRQQYRHTYSLLPQYISGKDNDMAYITPRDFKKGEYFHAQYELETYFNHHFTLSHTKSWQYYRVSRKLALSVISFLRSKTLPTASLHKIPKLVKSIRKTEHSTVHITTYRPTLMISLPENAESTSPLLHQESGPGITVLEIRSKLNPYWMHSQSYPRPTNWLENRVPFNKRRENTLFP